jgi:hypothetical protein
MKMARDVFPDFPRRPQPIHFNYGLIFEAEVNARLARGAPGRFYATPRATSPATTSAVAALLPASVQP